MLNPAEVAATIKVSIPFLSWTARAALQIDIPADIEERWHLRAALEIVVSRKEDLVGASLVGARLDRASLVGARLDRASLVGARLDGARLDGARLVGARLFGASLVGASLDGARLDGASLDRASLVGASLVGARLDRASLVGARLDRASLVGARHRELAVRAVNERDDLIAALAPSEGGSASFADELLVVAEIIERYDAGSGLHRHLRERAQAIAVALSKAGA